MLKLEQDFTCRDAERGKPMFDERHIVRRHVPEFIEGSTRTSDDPDTRNSFPRGLWNDPLVAGDVRMPQADATTRRRKLEFLRLRAAQVDPPGDIADDRFAFSHEVRDGRGSGFGGEGRIN